MPSMTGAHARLPSTGHSQAASSYERWYKRESAPNLPLCGKSWQADMSASSASLLSTSKERRDVAETQGSSRGDWVPLRTQKPKHFAKP